MGVSRLSGRWPGDLEVVADLAGEKIVYLPMPRDGDDLRIFRFT
jgi:hypothetical protein